MTILVISHTEHYLDTSGQVCGWGPTVREMDYLADTYGQVIHVACLDKTTEAPPSSAAYQSANVRFVAIPSFGGMGLKNKFKIFTSAPTVLSTVFRQLKQADIFQFRAPTSMGLYVIPALSWFTTKRGWYKYAGNWVQNKKPLSYQFQKRFLESCQKRPVTINGQWEGQKRHVFTFENPSLTSEDLAVGKRSFEMKDYTQPLVACFVGRLETPKGVDRIIQNLELLNKKGIGELHFVGDGPRYKDYKAQCANGPVKCYFHGFADKDEVIEVYTKSHVLLLPSTASEGFPKVIAEAANFGCVPIVSNVSSIPQYVNETNGFLWDVSSEGFSEFLEGINLHSRLKNKALLARSFSKLFTFEALSSKFKKYIFR